MRIVFSFDDGRQDAFVAYQLLKKHGLKGSFHITTGFIDGSFATDAFGINRAPLSNDQILEMHNNGMDISSHGDRHVMDSTDFISSIQKLKNWGIDHPKIGFSVPNSDYTAEELEVFVAENRNDISYVRVGRDKHCYSFWSKVSYVLYHITHFQYFYNAFNKYNLLDSINAFEIHSLVVLSDCHAKNLIRFIDKYNGKDVTLVLMFHSIVDSPNNKWEYSSDEFDKICGYVSCSCENVTLRELTA